MDVGFILTLLITILIILLFRRIDKSNLKINKVKRFAEKAAAGLEKMLQNKKQEIHDATIDLDVLLKRASVVVEETRGACPSAEARAGTRPRADAHGTLRTVSELLRTPERLALIIEKLAEHRPWFDDRVWENREARVKVTNRYIIDAAQDGAFWEIWKGWRDAELVGVALLNQVDLYNSAQCHFVFFDRKLADKQQFCFNAMDWAFERFELEVLRVEIPTYARALANWARKKLGFRYEAEARPFSWPANEEPLTATQAVLGSRKHKVTLYRGQWHDALLLSITREEFKSFHERLSKEGRRLDSADAGADAGSGEHSRRLPRSPADGADPQPVPTD